MDGVASADTADVTEQPHWTTLNQSQKVEIVGEAIYYLAVLSVITPKVLNLG